MKLVQQMVNPQPEGSRSARRVGVRNVWVRRLLGALAGPVLIAVVHAILALPIPAQPVAALPPVPADVQLSADGSWCWFQDERAIVVGDYLVAGSVASGSDNPSQSGDIFALVYNLRKAEPVKRVLLHSRLLTPKGAYDDHNAPAFLALPDGSVLAVYAMHGDENAFYAKRFRPEEEAPVAEGARVIPSPSSRVTYSNLYWMPGENAGRGRIYNFFRGLDDSFKPSYSWSDDLGRTWQTGSVFINVPLEFRHRPYAKYASDGAEAIHVIYTEGHPRDFDNSIYHVFYRGGMLHGSDGKPIRPLREGLRRPEEGTRVFAGDASNVAWTSDMHLDAKGAPHFVFTVQKDGAGKPADDHGMDLRYHYARWDGKAWQQHEIGHAGSRLYPREADYTGNISLDPQNLNIVYFSTNAHPRSGQPLVSSADDKRHWEVFRGETRDGGRTWEFTALTANSTQDNLRPIVPAWPDSDKVALLWLKGEYRSYTGFSQSVMLRVLPQR